jgi:hypothetical protein
MNAVEGLGRMGVSGTGVWGGSICGQPRRQSTGSRIGRPGKKAKLELIK